MATIKDVARYSGVSVGTVSNYINRKKPVSEEKMRRIEAAIQTLHFIPNKAASNLKKQEQDEIGIILPNFNDKYYVDIFYGIQNFFLQRQKTVNVFLSNNDPELERKNIALLLSRPTAGILISSCQPDEQAFFEHSFAGRFLPVLEIDHRIRGTRNDYIAFDNRTTIRTLTELLLKQGAHSIFLFAGPSHYTNENEAVLGYQEAFASFGIPFDESCICTSCIDRESAFKSGAVLLSRRHADAVIATSETFALGIHEILTLLHGTSYQTNIIAPGHSSFNSYAKSPCLFSVNRSAIQLGRKAAELLSQRLQDPGANQRFSILKDELSTDQLSDAVCPMIHKNIKLSILMLDNQLTRHIARLLPDFERKSGISVELYTAPHKQMYSSIGKAWGGV